MNSEYFKLEIETSGLEFRFLGMNFSSGAGTMFSWSV